MLAMGSRFLMVKELAQASTLLEILSFRALETGQKEAFSFGGESVSFERLWDEVNRVAIFLIKAGVLPGDRVVLMIPNGIEFFSLFYGIMRAGAVAVPIYPGSGEKRVMSIIADSEARALFVPSEAALELFNQYQAGLVNTDTQLFWLRDALSAVDAFLYPLVDFPKISSETTAFFQYSSGSTGVSKGVILTHGNLVANLRQMIAASLITDADVMVSWLPVWHDLGLILMTMAPFYAGARLVLLPTTLTKMSRWLEAISAYRGTYTAAPDIGYRQAIKQIRNPEKYDLSSLRVAINAAEPVRAKTVYEFEQIFGLKNIIKPAYGLAEASVGVSFWGLESKPIKVDSNGHVAIGYPLPDLELKIVVGDRDALVGETGELVFKSPSGTKGYFKNETANNQLFWKDFIRTGDLAYQDGDGDIFLIARQKNQIKQGGRGISPREVEEFVDDIESVRMSAAIGVDRGDFIGEQLVVFVEARLPVATFDQDASALFRSVVNTVYRQLGLRPAQVYIVEKGTIPFTHNGKLQHLLLKQQFLDGSLNTKILYPNRVRNDE